ncbi:MAG: TPM domain-containing protein [Bacteroidales bacterium]|nr:TPM domain-containing protein [Bacteroidales bacterium]
MKKAQNFFSDQEKSLILKAIQEAEHNTSGEIRVHLENYCKEDVLDRAAYLFGKLQMHKTEKRNGVLFYLAVIDKKFAILGDAGINGVTPDNFWDEIKETMSGFFSEGKFAEGLAAGIFDAGKALKEFFPYQQDDVNELSDDISFGKN